MKRGFVYIMASRRNGTIYTGSTSNLVQRVWQHRNQVIDGFTQEHECVLLVWFEVHDDLQEARRASCRSRSGTGRGSCGSSKRPTRIRATCSIRLFSHPVLPQGSAG